MREEEKMPCVAPEARCSCGTGETQSLTRPTSPTGPTSPTSPTVPTPAGGRIADSLGRIAEALEELVRAAKKETETFPPAPPYKEKENLIERNLPRTRVRERNLTCEGFLLPTLDEVKAVAATLGIPADIAEDFWNTNSATGWTYRGSRIINWHPLLQAWHRSVKRSAARDAKLTAHLDAKMDERADKRTAHIDAKMDEREKKRERRTGGRRKADNNVEMSEEVREEVRRDFAI